MKKTQQIILTLTVALVVQFCFLQQLVTAYANESVIARRMMESGNPKRSYYEPYFTGYFNRDVYSAAVLSNDVYEDKSTAQNLVPEYSLVYRYHEDNYVFNIYVSTSEKKLVISFRGSAGWLLDWIQNFNAFPISYQITYTTLIKIHAGFLDEILEYKHILKNFVNGYTGYSIIWTGHSQGGALAQVAATLVGQELSIPISRSHLITFGSPAAGNSDFANFASKLVKHTRVVNAFPCWVFDCFEVDVVTDSIPIFEHFGEWFPMKTRYDDYFIRHSMTNYQTQVKKRVMFYDLISLSVNPPSITYQQSSRIFFNAYETNVASCSGMVLYFTKGESSKQAQFPCTITNGAIDITSLPPGEYNLQGKASGYSILTFPNKLNIANPPFQCPFSCNGCDYISSNCTSCVNGFYGPLCQFYCSPNCLSCKNASSCLTCKNPTISSPPTCAPKCSNCVNGQCIEGQCVCNTGYGGVNCTSIICPTNCLKCSSPYLCSSCLPEQPALSHAFLTVCNVLMIRLVQNVMLDILVIHVKMGLTIS